MGLGIYQFFPQKPVMDQYGEVISKGRFYYISKG